MTGMISEMIYSVFTFLVAGSRYPNGPRPRQEVVVMAVRKAVRAATIIFTASSIMRCFFFFFR